MSVTVPVSLANPSPPVAPAPAAGHENWLASFGDAGPAARLLSVLERLETSQANLTAADGGKAGLIRKTSSPLAGEASPQLHAEVTALRQENQALRATQQQAANRLANLLPSLAAHLHAEAAATATLADLTPPAVHEAAA